jgi:hypothetical protein
MTALSISITLEKSMEGLTPEEQEQMTPENLERNWFDLTQRVYHEAKAHDDLEAFAKRAVRQRMLVFSEDELTARLKLFAALETLR